MKDYSNFCHCLFDASPSRVFINNIWGGCRFGHRGFKFMCNKCKHCIKQYENSNLQEAIIMENKKIYNDDVERVVNNGHENRRAKNMQKYEKRRKRMVHQAILFAIIGLVFALFGICKWLVGWLAFPIFFGFVMYATFCFGRFFESGKRWGWK